MTDEDLNVAMLPLRSSTSLGRLNMAECRTVWRAMEVAGMIDPRYQPPAPAAAIKSPSPVRPAPAAAEVA